jgi:PilZ domain-containing protein
MGVIRPLFCLPRHRLRGVLLEIDLSAETHLELAIFAGNKEPCEFVTFRHLCHTSRSRIPAASTMATSENQSAQMRVEARKPCSPSYPSGDSRSIVRYSLNARATFHWKDHGVSRRASGETRDISHKGAYIAAPECPAQGAIVSLNIYLPALAGENCHLHLEAVGRVLRVETKSNHKKGFAVANDRVSLRTASEPLALANALGTQR